MTNKQIIDAQKILRSLEGTPTKFYREDGEAFWQVTYDNDTYNALLNIIVAVSRIPIKETYIRESYVRDTAYESVVDYHRDKI